VNAAITLPREKKEKSLYSCPIRGEDMKRKGHGTSTITECRVKKRKRFQGIHGNSSQSKEGGIEKRTELGRRGEKRDFCDREKKKKRNPRR